MSNRAVFPANLDQLHLMLEWIQMRFKDAGFDEQTLKKVELASEEAIVNIILHGYADQLGQITVEVKQRENPDALVLTFRDQAPPFNPLEHNTGFDPDIPLEEREIGGLGIFLMRQYMDDIEYKREGSANVLTLTKRSSRTR